MRPTYQQIKAAVKDGIDPQKLLDDLTEKNDRPSVIEAIQRAIESGKISLDGDGMVVSIDTERQS
jgi:hypothetical protein